MKEVLVMKMMPGEVMSLSQGGQYSRRTLIVVAPGVVLAAVLTAWGYSSKPMWRDEWYTYSASERSFSQLIGLVSHVDGGLSAFYLFMHSWMLAGDSVAWMRLPAGLCTILIAGLAALIGRRVGGLSVGILSGILVALLPAVVDHAQEARAYPLVLAATAGTGLMMLRYLERPSRGGSAVLLVMALVAASIHPIVGAPAVAGIFLGSLVAPGRARRRDLMLSGLPAGIAAMSLLAIGFTQVDATSVSSYGGYPTLLHLSTAVSPSLGQTGIMASVVMVAIASLFRRDSSALLVLLGWSVVPIVTIALSAMVGSFSLARYVSAAAIGIGVLTACGIIKVSAIVSKAVPLTPRRSANVLIIAMLLSAVAVPLAPDIIDSRTQPYRVDNPKSATRALYEQWRPGDAAIFVGPVFRGLTDFYSPIGFRPADPLLELDAITDNSYRGREVGINSIKSDLEGYRRVWLVGLLKQDYESNKKKQATAGRKLIKREDFGEFSIELWQ